MGGGRRVPVHNLYPTPWISTSVQLLLFIIDDNCQLRTYFGKFSSAIFSCLRNVEDLVHVRIRLDGVDQPEDGGRNDHVKASDKPQVPRTFGFRHFLAFCSRLKSVKNVAAKIICNTFILTF